MLQKIKKSKRGIGFVELAVVQMVFAIGVFGGMSYLGENQKNKTVDTVANPAPALYERGVAQF